MSNKNEDNSICRMVGMAAMVGDIMAGDTLKEKNDWKLRMLKAGFPNSLMIPDDWDSLPEEEKAKRLDAITKILTEDQ